MPRAAVQPTAPLATTPVDRCSVVGRAVAERTCDAERFPIVEAREPNVRSALHAAIQQLGWLAHAPQAIDLPQVRRAHIAERLSHYNGADSFGIYLLCSMLYIRSGSSPIF
jgi:hypothetical protein